MSIEAMKQALEALEQIKQATFHPAKVFAHNHAIIALRAALEQPAQDEPCPKCKGLGYYDEGHENDDGSMSGGNYVECEKCKAPAQDEPEFIRHEVENAEDWSEWVCPDPKGYLMKCCDCGLVHEAEFMVVRYKSESEREVCEPVDDPNLQAVFRMRRNEQWSPKDAAYRPGGLSLEQPAQDEPVAWMYDQAKYGPTDLRGQQWRHALSRSKPYTENGMVRELTPLYTTPQPQRNTWKNAAIRLGEELSSVGPDGYYNMTAEQWLDWAMDQQPRGKNSLSQPQREWVGLTDEDEIDWDDGDLKSLVKAIEAKLKEKNT